MTTIASARPTSLPSHAPRPARKPFRSRLATFLKYASLVIASFATVTPLGVIVIASLKTNDEFANTGPFTLPRHATFANYVAHYGITEE